MTRTETLSTVSAASRIMRGDLVEPDGGAVRVRMIRRLKGVPRYDHAVECDSPIVGRLSVEEQQLPPSEYKSQRGDDRRHDSGPLAHNCLTLLVCHPEPSDPADSAQ